MPKNAAEFSSRRERAHTEHFVFAHWFESGFGHRDDGNGVTQGIEHLGAVTVLAVAGDVMRHQRQFLILTMAFRPAARMGVAPGCRGSSPHL